MTTQPCIMLIDDDHGPMDYYVEALKERGFAVTQIDCVDDAFRWVENPSSQPPDCLVIDIMLPPGFRLAKEETENGLRSGVLIAEACRKRFAGVPLVVLTNRPDPEATNSLPEGTMVKAKFDVAPFAFADFVRGLVNV